MAIKYVDLEASGTGTGTMADPYDASSFLTLMYNDSTGYTGSDSFKIKGSYSQAGPIYLDASNATATPIELGPWIPTQPWRLKSTYTESYSITLGNVTIDRAILDCSPSGAMKFGAGWDGPDFGINVYSSFLKALSFEQGMPCDSSKSVVLKGCTAVGTGFYLACAAEGEWYDCIIDGTVDYGYDLSYVRNCVFTWVDPGLPDQSNCQFSWTPPTWPAWDADLTEFRSGNLTAGINTPPQPGNSPYTDYATGLAGGDRTGIGGVVFGLPMNYFSSSAVAVNTPVTSTVNKTDLVNKIQGVGSDTYFDQTSEVHSVHVRYEHSDDRQRKTIIHTGTGLTGSATWSDGARDGTWEKNLVTICDRDGAKAVLSRSDIGSNEDVVKSGSTVFLNN